MLLKENWLGLFYLHLKFGLVFLLAVENRSGLFTYCSPPVRKLDLVIFAYDFPTVSKKRRAASKNTSIASRKGTSMVWLCLPHLLCEIFSAILVKFGELSLLLVEYLTKRNTKDQNAYIISTLILHSMHGANLDGEHFLDFQT